MALENVIPVNEYKSDGVCVCLCFSVLSCRHLRYCIQFRTLVISSVANGIVINGVS